MSIANRWQRLGGLFSPMSLADKEKVLAKRAKRLEGQATHAEKEAKLRDRIAKAKKRIKDSESPNILSKLRGGSRALIAVVVILAIVLLLVKVC